MSTEARRMTTIEWARAYGAHYRARFQLDNHDPAREWAELSLFHYSRGEQSGWVLDNAAGLVREAEQAVYLLDDGRVEVCYVAGWDGGGDGAIILHPIPVNTHPNGAPVRGGDGNPADYSGWQLGPRRAYHVKITPHH